MSSPDAASERSKSAKRRAAKKASLAVSDIQPGLRSYDSHKEETEMSIECIECMTYIYIYICIYKYIRHIKTQLLGFTFRVLKFAEPVVVMSNVSGKGCRLRCRWDLGTRTSKKWNVNRVCCMVCPDAL